MCGIAAIFSNQITEQSFDALLLAYLERIAHRGPDDYGMQFGRGCGLLPAAQAQGAEWALGHRRLSILDLSEAGRQPMSSVDGRLWITYNGEIYNYQELRDELKQSGAVFRTGTDTEVILAAYATWGDACVERFIGMFVFLIVDLRQDPGRVFAARDRLGVKPLYLHLARGYCAWASEPKQFGTLPGFTYRANPQMVADFLGDGVLEHEPTLCCFSNVQRFPAAHRLSWPLNEQPDLQNAQRYWHPTTTTCFCTASEAVERLRDLLESTVALRMRSDVPVGSCLSGGMDSSTIVGLARAHAPVGLHTFSSCFGDSRFDEQFYIDAVVRQHMVTAHKVFPDPAQLENDLDALVHHQDEPFGSLSIYAQFCVMRAAREAGVPVLLDGQGGDEAFCGYRKYAFFYLRQLVSERHILDSLLHGLRLVLHGDRRQFQLSAATRYLPRWLRSRKQSWSGVLGPPLRQLLRPVWSERMRGIRHLHEYAMADLLTWSLPVLLRYEDRNSMAHSIEARVPLVDHRLIEFCLQLPEPLFFQDGRTKRLLAKAVEDLLPREIVQRRTKMGFETPQELWLRGPLGKELARRVRKVQRLQPLIDVQKIADLLDGSRIDPRVSSSQLFRLTSVALWVEQFQVEVA